MIFHKKENYKEEKEKNNIEIIYSQNVRFRSE